VKSWHLREWGYARGTNVRAAWNTQAGSSTARVVVVDTGVEATHPDLKKRLVSGFNFADNNLNWSDCNGHGTAVAGLIGAVTDNQRGVAGIDMRGGIYVARVNVGCSNSWSNAAMASAIATTSAWANTRVINISGGGTFNDPAVARAVALARSRGVVVVAAAGNNNSSVPFFPAANDGVLAVGASTKTAQRASFSNFGWPNVNVAAPGEGICTTALIANGRYTCGWNGTSFASPIVAGIAMLVRAQYPAISETTTRAQIEWASWNPERNCWNCYSNNFGFGIVQAYAAVTSVR
jgi:thermitase